MSRHGRRRRRRRGAKFTQTVPAQSSGGSTSQSESKDTASEPSNDTQTGS